MTRPWSATATSRIAASASAIGSWGQRSPPPAGGSIRTAATQPASAAASNSSRTLTPVSGSPKAEAEIARVVAIAQPRIGVASQRPSGPSSAGI